MNLTLIRNDFLPYCTIGNLLIDDVYFCKTLEDTVRLEGVKAKGKTAIPYGKYQVITNHSNRFKRVMPLLLNVPGFEGVRIHTGNTAGDTEGCILLGYEREMDYIIKSKQAFDDFFPLLQKGLEEDRVDISIIKRVIGA